MKILQIIQRDQLRGAEIFACQLSESLIRKGVEVDVMILFGPRTHSLTITGNHFCLNANEKRMLVDFSAFRKIAKMVRQGNYDIVQANAGDTLKYAALSKFIFRWPAKLVFRNANKASDYVKSFLKIRFNSFLVEQVDQVASVSSNCRMDFIQLYNFPKSKVDYLPIGVEIEKKNQRSDFDEWGIEGGGPVLIHAGGFVPEKNHFGLLKIFREILIKIPNAKLLLLGTGPLLEYITSISKQWGMEKNALFLGSRKDIQHILPLADVFVLPSLIEGLPAVILEAFNSRVPVVAYNVGGIGEVVKDRETGILVPIGDEIKFAAGIVEVIQHKPDLMIQTAYEKVVSEFSIGNVAERFFQFYKKCLN